MLINFIFLLLYLFISFIHLLTEDLYFSEYLYKFFIGYQQTYPQASQVALVVKNPPVNVGDVRVTSSIPGSGRFPGGRHGNPLQYSCLENSMDRGAWWATVLTVTESDTTQATQDACRHVLSNTLSLVLLIFKFSLFLWRTSLYLVNYLFLKYYLPLC